MDDDQQFCLRWNNHQSTLISVFDSLLEHEALTDCTLAAEGKLMKAHKVVLSACSPYFAALLQEQYDKHPIFILKDIKFQELKSMIDYMYRGEVNICQDQLAALLKAAESLQIKGLSDNRSSSVATAPKPEHHRATLPTAKLSSGYTLEQTKRARIAGAAEPEIGSREGSCSPSRRRRKVRRRSIENALSDVHDNSNSSQHIQQTQSNASGLGAITAAASALAAVAAATPSTQSLVSNIPLSASTSSSTAVTAPGTTLSSSKKTDIVKGTTQHPTQHDAMNTENAQGPASAIVASGSLGTETTDAAASTAIEKSNHKQMHQHKQAKDPLNASGAASSSELVIEPKAEYDDEANDEPVEDLTLDEDDVGIDDLDQNAGTSQAGEGSSQGYAPWQHDRSPDELLLATQEAQQRDPQDLSITRIAGLTWNEWNARLAMPLVTQLREGVHPLVFPTDLRMEKAAASGNGVGAKDVCKIERKSPLKRPTLLGSPTPSSNDLSEQDATSTPLNCSSASDKDKLQASNCGGGGKIKHFTEEEATVLMLKAAAEKNAQAANNSGNLSDNSYTDDNTTGNLSGNGGNGSSVGVGGTAGTGGTSAASGAGSATDYHSAFADVGSASGISLNILNSINAMSSLISGGAGGNGGLSLAGATALGVGGSGNGAGHPCPECGRVYKLKSSLRNHQKWECGKEPQFQCPFCVYRAKQKMHIGRHMERMHKEKFFKIEDLKSFTTATVGAQLAGSSISGGGGGGSGGVSTVASAGGDESSSSTAVAELRQHFS